MGRFGFDSQATSALVDAQAAGRSREKVMVAKVGYDGRPNGFNRLGP
jgi:hypothetical protein